MLWQQILLALCGCLLIVSGVGQYKAWNNGFIIYRHIADELDSETRTKYQKSLVVPYMLLGLSFIAFAVALPYIDTPRGGYIAAAVMGAILLFFFVWHFVCNKKYLGRFTGPDFKNLFK